MRLKINTRILMLLCFALALSGPVLSSPYTEYSMPVNGRALPYTVYGEGETIVLVHGAVSDQRTWSSLQNHLAEKGFQAIAFTQRYYGVEPWEQSWPPYRIRTHADDLTEFLRKLDAAKVHLVAWSSGGHIALTVANEYPELVKSVLIYEPVVPSYVEDEADLHTLSEDANAMVGPIFKPMNDGKLHIAAELFLDGVSGQAGYFKALANDDRQIVLDNARVLPLMFDGGESDVPISCSQLRQINLPVMVVRGQYSRKFFALIADSAMACISGNQHRIVDGVGHMWPGKQPEEFSELISDFIQKLNEK